MCPYVVSLALHDITAVDDELILGAEIDWEKLYRCLTQPDSQFGESRIMPFPVIYWASHQKSLDISKSHE